MTLEKFKQTWRATKRTERSASHEHFLDVCRLLGQPTPAESDQAGESYTFDKHVTKPRGGKGFADVWKRGHFAWEYKGPDRDLRAAYAQLHEYLPDLDNPPLLVVSDLCSFQVHTNFVNAKPRVFAFTVDELGANRPTDTCPLPPLDVLHAVFGDYNLLRPEKTAERVTADAAREFLKLAEALEIERAGRQRATDRPEVAHFLMRILFCLFADSIGLLPDRLFRDMIQMHRTSPRVFVRALRSLFAAMAEPDGMFGQHEIPWFNGGLFEDDHVLDLDPADMRLLAQLSFMDWSHIAPAIFGTLFERAFVKEKRPLIGAHYTSPDDINLLIEPVLLRPLEARWNEVRAQVEELSAQRDAAKGARERLTLQAEMESALDAWLTELSQVRVLDPACGSGNFLYLSLRAMLDLWLKARNFAADRGITVLSKAIVNPSQLYGIEQDFYSHELASIVVWIGYLQWRHEHGVGQEDPPILRKLTNIQHDDAILRYNANGTPYEPEWPEAEYIVGNPPFLGGNFLRRDLGDKYVDDLFFIYDGRVPAVADLVTYWFEKARRAIEKGHAKRVGLLATQAIRGGANREVLTRILQTGGIFWAQSDREWQLDGAAVRVSMVAFDDGTAAARELDGKLVSEIHANLTSGSADITTARPLPENHEICFMGPSPKGKFDINADTARKMLHAPVNVNGKPNSDVVRPVFSALDITRNSRNKWTVDFNQLSVEDAAKYELPFEYVKSVVKPTRTKNRRQAYAEKWWQYAEPRPGLRMATKSLRRSIATPAVAKHRIFVWLAPQVLANQGTLVIARADDYFFGVLHSRFHEVWALMMGTQLESRPRYTPTSTFETFPFPWPPGKEPKDNPQVLAIAQAAAQLVELRDKWLNPADATAEELAKRTLTNLYNKQPDWLLHAHAALDAAVAAAYGWPAELSDQQILGKLLALNLERSSQEKPAPKGASL